MAKSVAVLSNPGEKLDAKTQSALELGIVKAAKKGYRRLLVMDGDTGVAHAVRQVNEMADVVVAITVLHPHKNYPKTGVPVLELAKWIYLMDEDETPPYVRGTDLGSMRNYCREQQLSGGDVAIIVHGGQINDEIAFAFKYARTVMPVYWINPALEGKARWIMPNNDNLDTNSQKVIADWKNSRRRR